MTAHDLPGHPTTSDETPTAPATGCLTYGVLVAIGLWSVVISGFGQVALWVAGQFQLIAGGMPGGYAEPLAILVQALVIALPIGLFAAFVRVPRLHAAGWLWLVASGLFAVFGLIRVLPYTWNQGAALAQLLLSALLFVTVWLFARWRGLRLRFAAGGTLLALALALLLALPWAALGALGSPLDTLLNLGAGLGLGLLAGVLFSLLLRALDRHPVSATNDVLLGGWAMGVTLWLLGAGFGFGGSQLLLLAALPPLGLAALALARLSGSAEQAWLPVGVLVGGAAAAPLLFVDPDEITLLLGTMGYGDVAWYALQASVLAVALALVVALVLVLLSRRAGRSSPLPLALGGLVVATIALVLVYLAGQPGFYGERLFVVLRDQADVSQASNNTDREDRLRFVYQTLTAHANSTQAELRGTFDRWGVGYTPYYLVNALEVDGGPLVRAYLATRPEVARVLSSPQLRPLPQALTVETGTMSAPNDVPWNILAINADLVWSELGVTGEGIVIGQSDSGVQADHPALRENYRGRNGQHDYNWFDPWSGSPVPVDYGGHGTHTLGTVAGRMGIGVAPDAQWFACANLQRNLGNPALYLDCMQFMLAPFPQQGDPFTDGRPELAAHVLNNSWGCPQIEGCDAEALAAATRALRAAGMFVVASAGNSGPECSTVTDPIAIYDDVLTVGAIDQNGDVTSFSSRGPVMVDGSNRPKPDLVAPGADVLSALPGSTYGLNDGTSMAGPHVAGVVALMWSANPTLIGDVDRTEQLLRETARPYWGTAQIGCFSQEGRVSDAYGYGVVDAYAAVSAALDSTP